MVKKGKKVAVPSGPVAKTSPPTEKGTGSIPHPHNVEDYDACGEPYKFTQHLPGACRGGETRPVGEQDHIQPFPDLQCQGFLEEMISRLRLRGQRKVG